MEAIMSNPEAEKLILSDDALRKSIPYLPLGQLPGRAQPAAKAQ
jgi:membrane protease subunit HflK